MHITWVWLIYYEVTFSSYLKKNEKNVQYKFQMQVLPWPKELIAKIPADSQEFSVTHLYLQAVRGEAWTAVKDRV